MAKSRTVAGAGTLVTAVLVLVFGNQAATEWIARHAKSENALGFFLHQLAWPSWAFGPAAGESTRNLLVRDLRAVFLIAAVAGILAVVGKAGPGGGGGFLLGWAALVFGSALAAFLAAFLAASPTFVAALNSAAAGSAYGLFVGWIVGIATGTAKPG